MNSYDNDTDSSFKEVFLKRKQNPCEKYQWKDSRLCLFFKDISKNSKLLLFIFF